MSTLNNKIERLLIKHHDECMKTRSYPKACLDDPTLKSPQYWREDVVIAALKEVLLKPCRHGDDCTECFYSTGNGRPQP